MDPYSKAINALEQNNCRYVVLGGFAVVLNGSNRFTPDINIAIDFSAENIRLAVESLLSAGFKAAITNPVEILTNEDKRQEYRLKQFYCLGFQDPEAPNFKAEILLEHPFNFDEMHKNALKIELSHCTVRLCSLDDLVKMKTELARPQDNLDIENLLIVKELLTMDEAQQSEFINSAETDFQRDQRIMLSRFSSLSMQEKLDWLINMLEELGHFCILAR